MKQNKIGIIGEPLIRLTTPSGTNFTDNNFLRLNFGGAEINVGLNLAGWDNQVFAITQLPNNYLGEKYQQYLQKNNIKTTFINKLDNSRIGIYYCTSPHNIINSIITYDRKDSAFYNWNPNDEQLNTIASSINHLHVSGITLALSNNIHKHLLKLINILKKNNKTISFDFNYRSKLWTLEEAKSSFLTFLPYIDYAFCGIKDLQFILNLITDGSNDCQKQLVLGWEKLIKKFPNLQWLACTSREILSPVNNNITGFLYTKNKFYASKKIEINNIIDRIGSGDAFVSAILHGIFNEWNPQTIVNFAINNCALKHTVYGDHNVFDINEIINFTGNAIDVVR